MAAPTSLHALLDSLSQSLNTAFDATPKLAGIAPPENGLSLLDTKNELLLSYLQNLVFLILLKIRNAKKDFTDGVAEDAALGDLVVKKLVELRLYLEKGVRPLEEGLRYQIEKALRVAEDSERTARVKEATRKEEAEKEDSEGSSSESGDNDEDEEEDEDEVDDANAGESGLKRFAANRAAMRPTTKSVPATENSNGVYRPPKVAPTVMPTTEKRERAERKPLKSATMDEFIADEFSVAPITQPSIGTDIGGRGRQMKTASQRKEEEERREYEERNFVRLPKEGKKDRAQNKDGRGGRMTFGGEEWRELGEGVDRINRLTKVGRSAGGGTRALLEKSRKRGIDTADGPRGSGSSAVEMGERYNKRLKHEKNRSKRR